jgi:hypothetical protein
VTEDKLKAVGKMVTDEEPAAAGAARYKLARKSDYDGMRQARVIFGTCSTLLTIVLVYYCMMKFVIHQPIPFEDQLTAMTQSFQQRSEQPGASIQQIPPTDPTAQQAPSPVSTAPVSNSR